MTELINWIIHQLQTNQMMQAAIVAAPVAALTYMARSLPGKFWGILKRCFSITIQFNSDMADYNYIQQLVMKEVINQTLSRTYVYSAEENYDWDCDTETTKHIGLTAGYGTHWGRYGKTPVWVERSIVGEDGGNATEKFKERMTITFLTLRRRTIERFAKMIEEKAGKLVDVPTVQIYVNAGSWWRRGTKLPARSLSTVFTLDNQGQKVVDAIRAFEADRDKCLARGMPHRLGILLKGQPGTGKSSLLHAVASETDRTIYYLNLGSVCDDKELTALVSGARSWKKAILVIEDFDATGAQVTREAVKIEGTPDGEVRKPLTLSALLNVLDGLLSPDGLVVVATTNHPEKLDPALTRPGRFDIQLDLGPLGWSEFEGMARLFDVDVANDNDLRNAYRPTPGSTLRALLIEDGSNAVWAYLSGLHPLAEAA